METLKAGIRYLRAENAYLKSCDLTRSLNLETLPAPVAPIKEEEQQDDDDNEEEENDESSNDKIDHVDTRDTLRAIATESRILLKDMRRVGATPKVVSLADHKSGKWQSIKRTPDYQYQAQQSALYTLKQRSEQLKSKIKQLQHTNQEPETKQAAASIQVSQVHAKKDRISNAILL